MRAAVLNGYGDPLEVVQVKDDIKEPEISGDKILVQIKASTVMLLDTEVLRGEYRVLSDKWLKKQPVITGFEIAGIAKSSGTHIKAGDDVYGYVNILRGGVGHAEFAVIKEDALYHKPSNISYELAAGLPVGMMTAMDAFENKVLLHAGDEVMIHGAAGGVGVYAIQLAKRYGARVTASSNSENEALMYQLGADDVCGHKLNTSGFKGRFKMFYDVAGSFDYLTVRDMLEPGGKYVTTAIQMDMRGMVRSTIDGKHVEKQMVLEGERGILKRIAEMIEAGEIHPVIDKIYPLEKIHEAYRRLEQHGKHGRVIISLDHDG